MDSLYFDNSLYENQMHYKISKYLDEYPLNDEYEELSIKCDNEEQYNSILDALFRESRDKLKISGTTNNPLEIIVQEDPRNNYRKFDESNLMEDVD
jgi:hypothetical protein